MGKADANSSMMGRHKKRINVEINNEIGELYGGMRSGKVSNAEKAY